MRIVYVTSMLPYGPGEAFVATEISALRKRGHEVFVVPMRPRGKVTHGSARDVPLCVVKEKLLSPRILLAAVVTLLSSPLLSLRALGSLVAPLPPRLLVQNAAVAAKGLWLSRIAKALRADHIHSHWATATATMAYIAAEVARIPWSFTAHRYDIYANNLLSLKARSAKFCRAISIRGARDLAARAGPGAQKVRLLHMGVCLPSTSSVRTEAPSFRIIVAANLRAIKGHIYLIRAVELLRDSGLGVEAEFAGVGPEQENLADEVTRRGLSAQVRFLGLVAHEKLLSDMRNGRWDAAVLPSIAASETEQEGIPVFLMEAMAMRLPVIATRTGSIPELLEGGAGVLVPDQDPVTLAEAIRRLANDREYAEAVASLGQTRVRLAFDIDSVAGYLVSWFRGEHLLDDSRGVHGWQSEEP